MGFELQFDHTSTLLTGAANITETRIEELNESLGHALAQCHTHSKILQAIGAFCDTLEELVICAFFYGVWVGNCDAKKRLES